MRSLHSWRVDPKKAIQIQARLRKEVLVERGPKKIERIGGADVAYSKEGDMLFGAIVVLTFPDLEEIDSAAVAGRVEFPYIPGLFAFREGPILLEAFKKLRLKPDCMIFEGHGVAHPRGVGLASHLGLWLDLPSIGCAKSFLYSPEISMPNEVGPSRGSFKLIRRHGEPIAALLRTRENVRPVLVSPGHRIDLLSSIELLLATCPRYRMPEPLRRAHELANHLRAEFSSP